MVFTLPFFLVSLFCSWFECEMAGEPPYIQVKVDNERRFLSMVSGFSEDEISGRTISRNHGPLVYTKTGIVEGFRGKNADGKDIYSFTGVPYGEPPTGHLRFRDPVMRKPWRGVLKATEDSPFCVQVNAATMGFLRGQEDCLYLDIHTPAIDLKKRSIDELGYPVIIWVPAGTHAYGRSLTYGSAYMLRENIIFVVINVRVGVLGYLATGDEASPGNWALKDQALAIKWVYENIAAFGGNPERIIMGGMSSGAEAAHAMLFTKNDARNLIKGIYGMSGNLMAGHGLDSKGRVQKASDMVARQAGCPTAEEGRSWEMVECLRRLDPYMLSAHQYIIYNNMPLMSRMWSPTVEPANLNNTFLSELPEDLYAKGEVPDIPLILTRAEDETGFFMKYSRLGAMQLARLNWWSWMPEFMQLTYRNTKLNEHIPFEVAKANFLKVHRFYLQKDTAPIVFNPKDFEGFSKLMRDSMYNMPMWKSLEMHNKIAPRSTYSYICKQNTVFLNKAVRLVETYVTGQSKAAHVSDSFLLFNNSNHVPAHTPGHAFDIASRRLINMIANFAEHGKPLYRTESGELKEYWTPIGDIENLMTLEIGLEDGINMILDPLPRTMRKKIWEQVKF